MKIVKIAFMALLLLRTAAVAFQVDFSKDSVERLFEGTSGPFPPVSEGAVLLPSRLETVSLPVQGGKKYLMQIRGRVEGSFVVEENERAHLLTLQSHQNRLSSTFSVIFGNAEGDEVSPIGRGTPGGFFLTKESHLYTLVFYAPPEAEHLKVRFQSNGRNTAVSTFQLVEESGEGTINPNPDFRYGELNYSGWAPKRDGRLYTRPDGKTVLNTGHLGASPFFPLEAGKRYRFSAKGEGAHLNAHYFDKEGKSIASRFILRPSPEGVEAEVVPPEGTVMARVAMSGVVILEELKVVEVR